MLKLKCYHLLLFFRVIVSQQLTLKYMLTDLRIVCKLRWISTEIWNRLVCDG